jgi:hypothetical protein
MVALADPVDLLFEPVPHTPMWREDLGVNRAELLPAVHKSETDERFALGFLPPRCRHS